MKKTRRYNSTQLDLMRLLMMTAITDSISFLRLSILRLASLPGRYVRKATEIYWTRGEMKMFYIAD
ncbi:hypothetical protein BBD40_06340 [Paenibacillus ihbetae]|uniref:Uncharacterized protein n=1 Tax=Paenibacillus ihbetae TaxID=1870820 RepID=A0ABX3JV27_9BACL|nr:hypothetical protein BBD40_06340 [Paenibacillus ihbetae]